jgi:hypothetical protein
LLVLGRLLIRTTAVLLMLGRLLIKMTAIRQALQQIEDRSFLGLTRCSVF